MSGLLFSNISATLAIFAVLLFRKFFKDKIFSKVFVLLWMAVIIRLLLPFEFSSELSIYSSVPEERPESFSAENFTYPENFPEGEFSVPEQEPNLSENQNPQKAKVSSDLILLSIWLSGTFFCGGSFAFNHWKNVKRLRRNCVPFSEVPKEFSGGKIRFYKSSSAASPLSYGIFCPTVIIPEDTSEEQLPFVLLHEHTHIKDHDAVLKAFALFALSLNWFNPAVWFMVKIFDRDIERCCDERVLFALGGEKALLYANTILDFAERESLSLSFFSAASLYERVTSIMNNKNKKSRFFAAAAIFSAVTLIMAACGTVPETAKEPSAPSEEISAAEELDKLLQNAVEVELGNSSIAIVDINSGKTVAIAHLDPNTGEVISINKETEDISAVLSGENSGFAGYMSLSEITDAGFYPLWMEPGSVIVYDSEGKPTVTKGAELKPEDIGTRNDIISVGFTDFSPDMKIIPETKAEYDLHGFIQNIYFLWPDGSYNLSPASTENSEPITTEGVVAFYWPCESRTVSANAKTRPGHKGIDIATGYGANVFASAGGKVVFAGKSDEGLGNYIVIAHDYGYSTVYAHCSELYVITGQIVETGEIIALTGSSGNSTGPHLHFELLYNEVQLDPEYSLLS